MENDVANDGIQDIPVENYFVNGDNGENEISSSKFSNYSFTGNTDEDQQFGTNCYNHLNCVSSNDSSKANANDTSVNSSVTMSPSNKKRKLHSFNQRISKKCHYNQRFKKQQRFMT